MVSHENLSMETINSNKKENEIDEKLSNRLYTGFLLSCAYSSTIGGIGSLGVTFLF